MKKGKSALIAEFNIDYQAAPKLDKRKINLSRFLLFRESITEEEALLALAQ